MDASQSRTLWISIGAALFAMFLLYSWSQEQKSQMAIQFGSKKRVVVASMNIAEMETIDESKLEYKEQPVDFIQPDAISEPEAAIGQVAAVPIKKGEQLLQTKLLLPGPDTGLSLEISPGKRAISIPIDDMRGVARLLKPGDRIDVLAALDYGKGADAKREVRTVLQDAVILATGLNVVNKIPRRFELDGNGKTINLINLSVPTNFSTITIEVKPEEAQEIVYILATTPGNLFTVLRHPNDRLQMQMRTTSADDILAKSSLRQPAQASQFSGPPTIIAAPETQAQPQPVPRVVAPPPAPPKKKLNNGRFEDL